MSDKCVHGKSAGSFCFVCSTEHAVMTALPVNWQTMYQWSPSQPPAPAPQGWECPKCNHVYAPGVVMCMHCPAKVVTSSDTASPE